MEQAERLNKYTWICVKVELLGCFPSLPPLREKLLMLQKTSAGLRKVVLPKNSVCVSIRLFVCKVNNALWFNIGSP